MRLVSHCSGTWSFSPTQAYDLVEGRNQDVWTHDILTIAHTTSAAYQNRGMTITWSSREFSLPWIEPIPCPL